MRDSRNLAFTFSCMSVLAGRFGRSNGEPGTLGTRLDRLETIHRYCGNPGKSSLVALCSYSGVDNSRNLGDYITEIERDDDNGVPGGATTIIVLSSVRRRACVMSRLLRAGIIEILSKHLTQSQ